MDQFVGNWAGTILPAKERPAAAGTPRVTGVPIEVLQVGVEVSVWSPGGQELAGLVRYVSLGCISTLSFRALYESPDGTRRVEFNEQMQTASPRCGQGGAISLASQPDGKVQWARAVTGLPLSLGRLARADPSAEMTAAMAAAAVATGPTENRVALLSRLARQALESPADRAATLPAFVNDRPGPIEQRYLADWELSRTSVQAVARDIDALLRMAQTVRSTSPPLEWSDLQSTPGTERALALTNLVVYVPTIEHHRSVAMYAEQLAAYFHLRLPKLKRANILVAEAFHAIADDAQDREIVRVLQSNAEAWVRLQDRVASGQDELAASQYVRLLALTGSSPALRKLLDASAEHYRVCQELDSDTGKFEYAAVLRDTLRARTTKQAAESAETHLSRLDGSLLRGPSLEEFKPALERIRQDHARGGSEIDALASSSRADARLGMLRNAFALPRLADVREMALYATRAVPPGHPLRTKLAALASQAVMTLSDVSSNAERRVSLSDFESREVRARLLELSARAKRGDRAAVDALATYASRAFADDKLASVAALARQWQAARAEVRARWGAFAGPVEYALDQPEAVLRAEATWEVTKTVERAALNARSLAGDRARMARQRLRDAQLNAEQEALRERAREACRSQPAPCIRTDQYAFCVDRDQSYSWCESE